MKKFLLLFTLMSTLSFAQKVNEYKYAIVPARFSFSSQDNQYQLSSLLKLFFQNQGYETYLSNESAPDDFINSNCNKLFIDIKDSSSMFNTKINVIVKDCKGAVLFTSDLGESREKSEEVAYNQALRMTLPSLKLIRHSTTKPSLTATPIAETKEEMVSVVAVDDGVLKSKRTVNGFDIFDGKSKLLYTLSKTSVKDIYIAKKDTIQGIVYQAEGHWFFEHYQGNTLLTEVLNIELK